MLTKSENTDASFSKLYKLHELPYASHCTDSLEQVFPPFSRFRFVQVLVLITKSISQFPILGHEDQGVHPPSTISFNVMRTHDTNYYEQYYLIRVYSLFVYLSKNEK